MTKLERDTAAFLAKGGQVQIVPTGVTGYSPRPSPRLKKDPEDIAEQRRQIEAQYAERMANHRKRKPERYSSV
tara:strand:+ start:27873 stop:28091 length:219 start_codon:yes stop_codon:yes gene_type:complete